MSSGTKREAEPTVATKQAVRVRPQPEAQGRPTSLTKKREDEIVRVIRNGATRTAAALATGISARTMLYWMTRGRAELDSINSGGVPDSREERYLRLLRRVESAEGEFETTMVSTIADARNVDWKAAAWLLERRRPHDYGRRSTVAVVGLSPDEKAASETPKPGDVDGKSDAELRRELADLGFTPTDIARAAKHEPMPDKAVVVMGAVAAGNDRDD